MKLTVSNSPTAKPIKGPIPAFVRYFHQLGRKGYADRIYGDGGMTSFSVTQHDRSQHTVLNDCEQVWLIYDEKEAEEDEDAGVF